MPRKRSIRRIKKPSKINILRIKIEQLKRERKRGTNSAKSRD
jgi:hypothetical protein